MSLLSEPDARRIEAAIARVEERSATELVVAVVKRSDDYATWRGIAAAAWAVAVAVIAFRVVPWGGETVALLIQIPVGLVAWAVLGIPVIHRRLIPSADADRAVRNTAFRIFAERGIHETRDRTGILLLISELEHRVELLGDRGIHERVGELGWKRYVENVTRRIREGRAADGVIELIEALGETLEQKVPVAPADVDELPNRVLRER